MTLLGQIGCACGVLVGCLVVWAAHSCGVLFELCDNRVKSYH